MAQPILWEFLFSVCIQFLKFVNVASTGARLAPDSFTVEYKGLGRSILCVVNPMARRPRPNPKLSTQNPATHVQDLQDDTLGLVSVSRLNVHRFLVSSLVPLQFGLLVSLSLGIVFLFIFLEIQGLFLVTKYWKSEKFVSSHSRKNCTCFSPNSQITRLFSKNCDEKRRGRDFLNCGHFGINISIMKQSSGKVFG